MDKTTATLLKGLLPNQELKKKLASVTFHLFSSKTQSSLSPIKPAAPTSCSRAAGSAAEATSVSASDDAKLTSFKLKTLVPLQRKMVSSNKDTKLQDKMLTLQTHGVRGGLFPTVISVTPLLLLIFDMFLLFSPR